MGHDKQKMQEALDQSRGQAFGGGPGGPVPPSHSWVLSVSRALQAGGGAVLTGPQGVSRDVHQDADDAQVGQLRDRVLWGGWGCQTPPGSQLRHGLGCLSLTGTSGAWQGGEGGGGGQWQIGGCCDLFLV